MRPDPRKGLPRQNRRDPQKVALELVATARDCCERGDLAAAVAAYEHALLTDSTCLQALQGRSALLAVIEAPATALAMYEDALAATDDHPELLVGRGHLRLYTADPAGALADYERAVQRRPNAAEYIAFRARAREHCGDVVGAIADYREASRMARPLDAIAPDAALRAVRLEIELGLGSE